jgi:hypothetical protein
MPDDLQNEYMIERLRIAIERAEAAEERVEELEAKLAKAVTFAEIVEKTGHGALWPLALDTLAELKGEDRG